MDSLLWFLAIVLIVFVGGPGIIVALIYASRWRCEECGAAFWKSDLQWIASTDGDECGIHVVYLGLCPYCYADCFSEYGYPTTPEEPLRHET